MTYHLENKKDKEHENETGVVLTTEVDGKRYESDPVWIKDSIIVTSVFHADSPRLAEAKKQLEERLRVTE